MNNTENEFLDILRVLVKKYPEHVLNVWPDPRNFALIILFNLDMLSNYFTNGDHPGELTTLLNGEWLPDNVELENACLNPSLKWSDERKLIHSEKMKKLHADGRYK